MLQSRHLQPPEFIQRFDEVFFVDLPLLAERKEIARIHISKVGRNAETFDLDIISQITDGYSGREIQKLVKEAMFDAFDANEELSTPHIITASKDFVPSSKQDKNKIEQLRDWAKGNARRANFKLQAAPKKGRVINN